MKNSSDQQLPLDYFKSTRSYSEKIDNFIVHKLDNSEEMREFAIVASTIYFNYLYQDYGKPVRFLSAYVYVNQNRRYVEENRDHILNPQFQLNLIAKESYLVGDCDDFTVFLASLFRCLEPADLIITSMKDHVFLELRISNEEGLVVYKRLIDLLSDMKEEDLYFEKDIKGYWLETSKKLIDINEKFKYH